MQSGVVDGVDTVKSSIDSYGFTSIGKYVWNSNHMFSSVGIVINKDVLAGLPQEYQDVLFSAWADATEASNQYVKDKDEEYISIFESQGATVTYTKDITEFHDKFHDYWYENAEKNGYSDLWISSW
jgi:TRAP-type C4-dicarboxylate transport system substrate-binding protein